MLRKVINSSTQQFEPVLVDKLVLDAVPTVNSFNSVTSDAVARAVAGASGGVPQVTESDNGKVLKAVYDEGGAAVEWGEAAPAVTVDQTYNSLSENPQSGVAVAEAIATVNQVPASTSSDENKVLKVNAQGVPGWAEASAGTEYSFGNGLTVGDVSMAVNSTVGFNLYPNGGALQVTGTTDRDTGRDIFAAGGNLSININGTQWTPSGVPYEVEQAEVCLRFATTWVSGQNYVGWINPTAIATISSGAGGLEMWTASGTYSNIALNGFTVRQDGADDFTFLAKTFSSIYYTAFDLVLKYTYNGQVQYAPMKKIGTPSDKSAVLSATIPNNVSVTIPVPSYNTTTDVGKVLQVTASGLEWVTLS